MDAAGNPYGTAGGSLFKFSPQPNGTWIETVLTTGAAGTLIFDKDRNLYGTTSGGGAFGGGTVFKASPNPDGTWVRTTLHSFANSPDDGAFSFGGVVFDAVGNLYGATCGGGTSGMGTVFQLKTQPDGSWLTGAIFMGQRLTVAWDTASSPAARLSSWSSRMGNGRNGCCTASTDLHLTEPL